jgi:phage-related protein
MAIPMSMAGGVSVTSTATNDGDSDSYPIIIFHGELEDPTLTNQTTGEQITLNYTLTAGQRIEIDTKRQTALFYTADDDPEGANVLQYIGGDWLKLVAGTNTLKLVTAVYNSIGYVNLQWRDKYLGI